MSCTLWHVNRPLCWRFMVSDSKLPGEGIMLIL